MGARERERGEVSERDGKQRDRERETEKHREREGGGGEGRGVTKNLGRTGLLFAVRKNYDRYSPAVPTQAASRNPASRKPLPVMPVPRRTVTPASCLSRSGLRSHGAKLPGFPNQLSFWFKLASR